MDASELQASSAVRAARPRVRGIVWSWPSASGDRPGPPTDWIRLRAIRAGQAAREEAMKRQVARPRSTTTWPRPTRQRAMHPSAAPYLAPLGRRRAPSRTGAGALKFVSDSAWPGSQRG